MNVTVIGTGYVGLVTGTCLAEIGNEVICVDIDANKIDALNRGQVPIYEPGLENMLKRNTKSNSLTFSTDIAGGASDADAIFLALPTPPTIDGSADLSAIMAVANQLSLLLTDKFCVIINKSTVPVGTAEQINKIINNNAACHYEVVSNPEFLREGLAIKDFMEPERIVVGVNSPKAEKIMRELYKPIISSDHPIIVTDPRTAELTKYAANTYLVTKISFMNEIAQLCERMGANIDVIRQALGADSRIGPKFLYPGIGCGGSCFPKDVRALKMMSEENDYHFKLLEAAMEINDQQKHVLVHKLVDHYDGNIASKTFAIWGLAFKPNTDDIREAPALAIIDDLIIQGAKVKAYDPEAAKHVRKLYSNNKNVEVVEDKYSALDGSTALLIATEWPEFKEASLEIISSRLTERVIFDGRNIFNPSDMKSSGFSYYSIGRRPVLQPFIKASV